MDFLLSVHFLVFFDADNFSFRLYFQGHLQFVLSLAEDGLAIAGDHMWRKSIVRVYSNVLHATEL